MTAKISVQPPEELLEFIPSFLENRRNELEEMNDFLHQKDFISISKTAHKWKGICQPYGFDDLGTYAIRLEKAAQQNHLADCKDILTNIKTYLDNVYVVESDSV
jgi:HPt (histidine-containing phosphotransfer) domain-containing protein